MVDRGWLETRKAKPQVRGDYHPIIYKHVSIIHKASVLICKMGGTTISYRVVLKIKEPTNLPRSLHNKLGYSRIFHFPPFSDSWSGLYFLGYLFPTILIPHLVIQTTWILQTFSIFVSFHIPPILKLMMPMFSWEKTLTPTFRSKWSSPSHSLSFKEWRLCPPLAGHHCPWYSSSDVLSMLSLTVMMTINIIP